MKKLLLAALALLLGAGQLQASMSVRKAQAAARRDFRELSSRIKAFQRNEQDKLHEMRVMPGEYWNMWWFLGYSPYRLGIFCHGLKGRHRWLGMSGQRIKRQRHLKVRDQALKMVFGTLPTSEEYNSVFGEEVYTQIQQEEENSGIGKGGLTKETVAGIRTDLNDRLKELVLAPRRKAVEKGVNMVKFPFIVPVRTYGRFKLKESENPESKAIYYSESHFLRALKSFVKSEQDQGRLTSVDASKLTYKYLSGGHEEETDDSESKVALEARHAKKAADEASKAIEDAEKAKKKAKDEIREAAAAGAY